MNKLNTYRAGVDEDGHFGIYGGRYVAETLMPLILKVEKAWSEAKDDKIVVGKTWAKVEAFINKQWGTTPVKPEVIRERKKSESTQRNLDWFSEA